MRDTILLNAAIGLLALLPGAAAVPVELEERVPPIVGGTVVASATTYPYMANLQQSGSFICGASILTTKLLVTAAHCVVGGTASTFKVRVGSLRYASGGTLAQVASFTVMPKYSSSTNDYDVAVLVLSTALTFGTTIAGATLVASGADPVSGTTTTTMGWGLTTDGGSVSSVLREVDVPVVARATCAADYSDETITTRMFCAGLTAGGKDSCNGDSGGPIIDEASGVLLGAVSWGYGCADAGYPGVYTSFADTELNTWIKAQVTASG
jgi:trypsin